MKIEWAPAKIPPLRRWQTFATGLYIFAFFGLAFTSYIAVALILFYGNFLMRTFMLIYIAYVYFDHGRRYSVMNGNGWMFLRNNCFGQYYRDYFPVELVKTAELPPNKNYVLVSFPHGVLGVGICINMGVDVKKWMDLFPGVRPKVATLDQHFFTPFLREMIRLWGFISVSKESLMYYLCKSNDPKHVDNKDGFTSNAVAILVGGAQEALDSHPGKYILTLKNRKGFVKIAIRTGSPIVPSLSFGEVDVFKQMDNPPDSILRRFQTLVKKITGVSPIVVVGRGFFNYTFGLLPHRKTIVQVIGAPIDVVQNADPDQKYVDEIHAKVIQSLETIFETYKEKYIQDSKESTLIIN